MVKIKRVYLPAEEADGYRILVDRLSPWHRLQNYANGSATYPNALMSLKSATAQSLSKTMP